ncbi:LLM class F420-dependent oxidoreductase [Novosphingobium sp. G106]|uniref:LLM class F420-dependent oxidoreductase n=1 Tax=Novosphingobium sp. G106 TaxID=2849500 RepID=UPI001C2D1220|nr:LLM class F420-dependent oxidoreductase [Novosphingobium sp. G106]MBV1691634.1 LLM class F420-dependent oxidoreductase [Novosphingobium sp. G106]
MKVGITCGGIGPYASGEYLRDSARAAEAAGFAHYWIPDHVVLFADYPESTYPYAGGSGQEAPEQSADAPLQFDDEEFALVNPRDAFVEPVVAMTWLAAATTTMEIGTNILVLPQRNPVLLAKELSTLDEFSQGRVILGIGAGWAKEDFDAMGVDFRTRGRRTDEMVAAMRRLWEADAASFEGEFFAFNAAYCYPKPVRPGGIPILIGGESKPAMRRVARSGNGWLPYNLPVEDAPRVIGELKAMTRAEGRDPDALRIVKIVYGNAALDDLKRYRDAGVTEFNVASSGEIPLHIGGINAIFAEFGERLVGPIGEL